MKHMKAVIGAGFGDEGKGFITYGESRWAQGKVLNVLYNGGVQRGHTAGGHVFHCFGSGLFAGADTYCDKRFMINPIGWLQERDDLRCEHLGPGFDGKIYVHSRCRVTTPFDMLLNQLLETARGNARHGSCGMGIWETARRHDGFPLYAYELAEGDLYDKLRSIERDYFRQVCRIYMLNAPKYVDIDPFMQATAEMLKHMELITVPGGLMRQYDTVIFEGGQGLLLDEDNVEYYPNVTASSTGSKYIAKYFDDAESYLDADEVEREVIYVTRSYATRHGAGRFEDECDKAKINPSMVDHTNVTNEWQGALRYGRLNLELMQGHISKDLRYHTRKPKTSLAVTQLNLTDGKIVDRAGRFKPQMIKYVIDSIDEVQEHYHDGLYWVRKHQGIERLREISEMLG